MIRELQYDFAEVPWDRNRKKGQEERENVTKIKTGFTQISEWEMGRCDFFGNLQACDFSGKFWNYGNLREKM